MTKEPEHVNKEVCHERHKTIDEKLDGIATKLDKLIVFLILSVVGLTTYLAQFNFGLIMKSALASVF